MFRYASMPLGPVRLLTELGRALVKRGTEGTTERLRILKSGIKGNIDDFKVIDIALDAGFQNAESFSRAFRTAFDQSPTQFRQQPDWAEWHRRVPKHTLQEQTSMDVNIISCPSTLGLWSNAVRKARLNDSAF